MRIEDLTPNDLRKSFYGKAKVVIDDNGQKTLFSYDTEIMRKNPDGTLVKLWDGWSATTGRHIKAFCGLNKKEYDELPIEVWQL